MTTPSAGSIALAWKGEFSNDEVNLLHADAFEHPVFDDDWAQLVQRHSLGWVTARREATLVGFVNVIWDGLVHAWLQDTIVASSARHAGVGTELVRTAERESRVAGCEWLHVDFDETCGRSTSMGAASCPPERASSTSENSPTSARADLGTCAETLGLSGQVPSS